MLLLTTEEACDHLGIKRASLYAYVSRGLLVAQPSPSDPRQSLYNRDEVERLATRRRAGRKRADIARGAIAWGEPVLNSAITAVRDNDLLYRGRSAIELSKHATLEDVLEVLLDHQTIGVENLPMPILAGGAQGGLQMLTSAMAASLPTSGRSPTSLNEEAVSLFDAYCCALTGVYTKMPAHEKLAIRWGLDSIQHKEAIDALACALVLLADHELNPSTFAARVAASTGACLPACALAGFATLTGPMHGQAAQQTLALLRSAISKSAARALQEWLASGRPIPGMGHNLYPTGDPRAKALLARLNLQPRQLGLLKEVRQITGQEPNIDFALACLVFQQNLPDEAAFLIFALARMAGWLAHAIEQATIGQPIRPRAHFLGPTLAG